MNELKSNMKYQPTTVSGNTHYYQPDTFTSDNVFDKETQMSKERYVMEIESNPLKDYIKGLLKQLQEYKDRENKLIELVKDYEGEDEEYIHIGYIKQILNKEER